MSNGLSSAALINEVLTGHYVAVFPLIAGAIIGARGREPTLAYLNVALIGSMAILWAFFPARVPTRRAGLACTAVAFTASRRTTMYRTACGENFVSVSLFEPPDWSIRAYRLDN